MTVGERIAARRKQLRITADDVAVAIRRGRSTYYKYEKGDLDIPSTVLRDIAYVLETTTAYLLGEEDLPETSTISSKEVDQTIDKPQNESQTPSDKSTNTLEFTNNFTIDSITPSTLSTTREPSYPSKPISARKSLFSIDSGVKMESDRMETEILRLPVFDSYPYGKDIEELISRTFMDIPQSWLKPEKSYFLYRVSNDEMYPKYVKDDILIMEKVDNGKVKVKDDALVFAKGKKDAILREIRSIDKGSMYLATVNAMYPQSYTLVKTSKVKGIVYKTIRDANTTCF